MSDLTYISRLNPDTIEFQIRLMKDKEVVGEINSGDGNTEICISKFINMSIKDLETLQRAIDEAKEWAI